MTSRERLQATLEHRQPDRPCVDFGGTFVTGIHVAAVDRLRRAVLGDPSWRVKVCEPYQMLGEIDGALREALGIDIIGVPPRKTLFGIECKDWKPFTLFDGTGVLVPGAFNTTADPASGDLLIYPEGDTSVPPSGRMPRGGYFFDSIIRQPPIDDDNLNVEDNLEEFGPLSDADIAYYREKRAWLDRNPDVGRILIVPGTAFGDIALVPAPFLKHPKGIRDIEEWYISTVARKDYVLGIFERQCAVAERNLDTLINIFGDSVDAALITGTDFGTQRGPFISNEAYRELFLPFHRRINALIHGKTKWKTFIHSCGSVYQLIPDFIAAGFDILNPVQCSAAEMDPARLKRQFGKDLVFWGGGIDTQKTLPFGTPDQVHAEVMERVAIFNEGGGCVFNAIHNIQGPTPVENMLALFRALRDSAGSPVA
ncbi:MAG TPA: uroporphyrinogen decarboxylase family protein [Verrucomicrobiae bacterium]|nr:uroporphyrinogen decarboxylase family protein [Verrucomicrobiae bacterium]